MTTATLHDAAAERAVLGSMLMSDTIAEQVTEIIDPTAYYNPAHAVVHRALVAAMNEGAPLDPIAIATRLTQAGDLERIGGLPYLHDLLTTVATAANAPWHARTLADLALRREIAAASIRIHQRASNLETPVADVIADAQNDLHLATIARNTSEATAFGDGLDEAIEEMCNPTQAARGLSTGIHDVDSLIGGLKPGQLILIAGRPGAGKSVLSVDMARATAIRSGLPALVISLEMSKTEVRQRVCSSECTIPLSLIRDGGMTDGYRARLRANADRLRAAPLYIDDNATLDLSGIRAVARRTQQRHGLSLLVVDYIQLVKTAGTGTNRTEEVGALSRGLKLLARELDIPVIAAAQLNRESEGRQDKRPQLSDLRESGSLEQDADIVFLLHRPDYYDKESPRAGEIDIIVAKNRSGPTDVVTAAAQLEFVRIVDMAQPR